MKIVCAQCNEIFVASRKDKRYCTLKCANRAAGIRRKERGGRRKTVVAKECKHCGKSFKRKSIRFKYCSDECRYQFTLPANAASARKKVRKRHAETPLKNCEVCNETFKPSMRSHKSIVCGEKCRKKYKTDAKKKYYEQNKKRLNEDNKKRHLQRMQDPENKRQHNEKSRLRRLANPVMVECVVCNEVFQRIRGAKTCGDVCSRQNEINQYQKRESRITNRLGRGLRRSFKGIISKWTWEVLDFTREEFVERFEFLFVDGMSWDNMSEWHIDHIRPIASFKQMDDINSEDFKECWALNNLQPLWASDNMSKGAKWDGSA